MIDIEELAQEHCHYQQSADQFSITLYGLKQFAEAYAAKVHDKRVGELEAKNRELSASINDLREAFRKIRSCYGDGYEVDNIARQALATTPAQSLTEQD